jgi:PAS domain S-box-containing protein
MLSVNFTVLQKGLVLAAVPLLFQLGFVLLIVQFQRDHVAAERLANHTKEVIAQAHEVRTLVSDADAGVGGYVIARDPTFATPIGAARQELPHQLDTLDEMVSDNPSQGDRVRSVRSTANAVLAWQTGAEELVNNRAFDEATARVRSKTGETLSKAFREEIRAFLVEEDRLDRERLIALERSRTRLNRLFVAGGIAAILSTLIVAFAFRRGIARRFATLEDNARRLAVGEPLAAPLTGIDEIARLDLAFRGMAAELTRASDEVRDLYDNAPCGYHSVDPEGTLLAVNHTELRWLGYNPNEVIGRMRFADLVSSHSREVYRATFERVKERGAAADVELELVRKDGSTFPVLLNSSAIRSADGRYLRSRTTLTDLTERKRAEGATRLFADVTRNIPVGLLIYQLDGEGVGDNRPILRVRSGNSCAEQLLGVPVTQAAGRAVTEVFPAIPDDQLRRYTQVAASGHPDDFGEFRYGDARVAERWWAAQAFALPDRSVGVAFQDVSERKRAEAEIRRLNEELEARVRSRTAELEAANRDLAQKNAENEMFVYSVSHDLRSPLVNLQGFSKELEKACLQLKSLLAGETVPPDVGDRGRILLDGKMAKSVGFIQTAVLRLSGIIDAMLRLSRAGRVEYRRETVDVGRLVGQVIGAAQGTIAERGAVVQAGELPPAWGDRTAIEQVFGNLIGNALTYLDPARPGVIEVGCLPPDTNGFQTYFVRDNGLGIAEGHRQKIFQAFQRAHPGVGTGEGLGLAIVARVAERHRGQVWVESSPGEGSTFFVTLPTTQEKNGRSPITLSDGENR